VVKIATFAKPPTVSTHPKKPTRPTINEQKKEIQMPTLRKIKRAVYPSTNRPKTAHLILPYTPKPTHHPNIVENFFGLFLSINFLSLILDII